MNQRDNPPRREDGNKQGQSPQGNGSGNDGSSPSDVGSNYGGLRRDGQGDPQEQRSNRSPQMGDYYTGGSAAVRSGPGSSPGAASPGQGDASGSDRDGK